MKALTISQPYASMIAEGKKWIENRHWLTDYRGRLAIHAGKGQQYLDEHELEDYPTGCVIAVCELTACFQLRDLPRLGDRLAGVGLTIEQVKNHEHTEGPWCWLLQRVEPLRVPRPCRGQRGLWDWNPE